MMEKRAEKKKTKASEQRNFSVLLLAFFVISFLGWAYETLLMFVRNGKFYDRGFLFLPFCPIYGFPVCLLYLLIGTPNEGRFAQLIDGAFRGGKKTMGKELSRYFLYYLFSGALATFVELVVGLACEGAGLSLWSYASEPYNFHGHICLSVSLFWGIALTAFMRFCMPPLLRLLSKIPKRGRILSCFVLSGLLIADFLVNAVLFFTA